MIIPLIVALSLLGAPALVGIAWLILIWARPAKNAPEVLFSTSYAHRGLWGEDAPENSLAAFGKAAEAGFGIELDVQLSADGEVFVFHDYTLDRMCGMEGKLSETPADVLRKTHLSGTEHTIPTLAEVLEVVGGRVPLLIELKGESGDVSLCPLVARTLAAYTGPWCVESFNPLLLNWFRKHQPRVVRGILVTDLIAEKKEGSRLRNFALSAQLLNCIARPNFIAWDKKYPHSIARKCNVSRGIPSFAYTVRSPEEYAALRAAGHQTIFEDFVPEKNEK